MLIKIIAADTFFAAAASFSFLLLLRFSKRCGGWEQLSITVKICKCVSIVTSNHYWHCCCCCCWCCFLLSSLVRSVRKVPWILKLAVGGHLIGKFSLWFPQFYHPLHQANCIVFFEWDEGKKTCRFTNWSSLVPFHCKITSSSWMGKYLR